MQYLAGVGEWAGSEFLDFYISLHKSVLTACQSVYK